MALSSVCACFLFFWRRKPPARFVDSLCYHVIRTCRLWSEGGSPLGEFRALKGTFFFFYVCARKKGSNHRKSFLRLRRLRWWNAPRAKLDRKGMFWPGEARACDLAFYISDWLLSAITWDWILFCQMTWHDCRWTTLVDSGFLRKGSQDNSGFHKGNLFCQIGYLEYCSYMPRETHKPKVFAEITDAWVSIVSVSPAGEQQQRQQKQN